MEKVYLYIQFHVTIHTYLINTMNLKNSSMVKTSGAAAAAASSSVIEPRIQLVKVHPMANASTNDIRNLHHPIDRLNTSPRSLYMRLLDYIHIVV